jgi:hypothetical protein
MSIAQLRASVSDGLIRIDRGLMKVFITRTLLGILPLLYINTAVLVNPPRPQILKI